MRGNGKYCMQPRDVAYWRLGRTVVRCFFREDSHWHYRIGAIHHRTIPTNTIRASIPFMRGSIPFAIKCGGCCARRYSSCRQNTPYHITSFLPIWWVRWKKWTHWVHEWEWFLSPPLSLEAKNEAIENIDIRKESQLSFKVVRWVRWECTQLSSWNWAV